jgi:hypothetical protein
VARAARARAASARARAAVKVTAKVAAKVAVMVAAAMEVEAREGARVVVARAVEILAAARVAVMAAEARVAARAVEAKGKNRKLVKRKTDHEYTGDGPAQDEKSWRHAVAVRNGFILDQNDLKISTRWLWLNDKSTPDREKRLYAGHTQSLQNYDLHGRRLLVQSYACTETQSRGGSAPGV